MSSLAHLLYTSRATEPLTGAGLRALAAQSVERNHSVGVTGMLLYSGGSFVQLLEGRAQTLEALMRRIAIDPRHTDVSVLLRADAPHRLFPRWYMGILNLDADGSALDRARVADALLDGDGKGDSGERIMAALREFRNQLPGGGA